MREAGTIGLAENMEHRTPPTACRLPDYYRQKDHANLLGYKYTVMRIELMVAELRVMSCDIAVCLVPAQ